MILISGTNYSLEELPFSDIMDYVIETNQQFLGIKLKTVAKSEMCLGVYLHDSLRGVFSLTEDVEAKTTYFSDDKQLFVLLENGGKEEPQPIEEEETISQEDTGVTFSDLQEPTKSPTLDEYDSPELTVNPSGELVLNSLEEVLDTMEDTLLSIPNIDEDVDSLKVQLEGKARIIAQKDLEIQEVKDVLNKTYELQEIQLLEMRTEYERKVDAINNKLLNLQEKLKGMAIPEELQWFTKYAAYARNFKAGLVEGFSTEDRTKIGKVTSKIHLFACGTGDSIYAMLKHVRDLLDTNPNAVVVDFTNDSYFTIRYRPSVKGSSLLLGDEDRPVEKLVEQRGRVDFIPTTSYHDIALLGLDWVKILNKLITYAKGKPIIFLFNSINNFSVRHTISKLSTIGQLSIFVKCNPVILSTLFGDVTFIPEGRFRIIATDYFKEVDLILNQLSTKYPIIAYSKQIKWDEIGVSL